MNRDQYHACRRLIGNYGGRGLLKVKPAVRQEYSKVQAVQKQFDLLEARALHVSFYIGGPYEATARNQAIRFFGPTGE